MPAKKKTKTLPSSIAVPQSEATLVHPAQSSVEFSRDAKGVPRWTIKLYGDLHQVDDLLSECLRLDAELRKQTSS